MSEVFEGYERQYCELSANLARKCSSTSLLSGQGNFPSFFSIWFVSNSVIDFFCCFCCIEYDQGNMNYHYYYCYSNFDLLEIIWIRIRCFFMLNDFVILLYDLMKCFYVNSVWLFEFIILLGLGLLLDLTKVTKFWFNYNIIIISVHLQTVMLDWDTRSGLLLLMHLMSRC
jgi:hypothetical protein